MLAEAANVDPGSGMCAEHAGRKASILCRHCGDFACGACTVDTLWGDTMCARCAASGRATYPLPWLRSLGPGAWLATSRAILFEAKVVFEHFPGGAPLRALAYVVGWLVLFLLSDVVRYSLSRHTHWAAAASGPDAGLFWMLGGEVVRQGAWLLLAAAGYFLALRIVGARATPADALSVTCYNFAFTAATELIGQLPLGGLISIPLSMLNLYFTAWTWSLVARTRFGVTRERAIVAGVLAFVAAFGLLLAVMAGIQTASELSE